MKNETCIEIKISEKENITVHMYDKLLDIFEYIIEQCKSTYVVINVNNSFNVDSKKCITTIDICIHINDIMITLGFEQGILNSLQINYKDIDNVLNVLSVYDNSNTNIAYERISLLNIIIECTTGYKGTYNEYIEYLSYYITETINSKIYVYYLYADIGFNEEIRGEASYSIFKYANQLSMEYAGIGSDNIEVEAYEVKELLTDLLEKYNEQSKDSK